MTQAVYLKANDVQARYGVSDMWIVRRLADGSGFPKPSYFGRQRFWPLAELEAWEASKRGTQNGTQPSDLIAYERPN